jgi:di/tricarboxylate transporter
MKGEGAIVFLVAFFALLLATLAVPSIPPGPSLYGMLGVPETDYPVLGIQVTTLVIAVFNGAVYGVIAWLVFTFGKRFMKHT